MAKSQAPNLQDMLRAIPRPTKTYHSKPYANISPSRPELSVKGKTVLITGGATGIGLEMTKAFAEAGAAVIALLARSQGPMDEAKATIEQAYPETKIRTYALSITDASGVDAAVKELGTIDILLLNAGTLNKPSPTLEVDPAQVKEVFDVNVFGPLALVKAFLDLPPRSPDAERTVVYTSSASFQNVSQVGLSIYASSKAAGTYLMSNIAAEYAVKKNVKVISFHPAFALTPMSKRDLGFAEGQFEFDDTALPGHFAVWLCSKEADFLNGRYLWAHWDVDDLKARKDAIAADPSALRIGVSIGEKAN